MQTSESVDMDIIIINIYLFIFHLVFIIIIIIFTKGHHALANHFSFSFVQLNAQLVYI